MLDGESDSDDELQSVLSKEAFDDQVEFETTLSLSVAYAGEGGGAPCAGTTAFVIAFVCCVSGALMLTVGLTLGRVCTVS